MAHTIKEERLRWVLPVAEKEIRLVDAARICPERALRMSNKISWEMYAGCMRFNLAHTYPQKKTGFCG